MAGKIKYIVGTVLIVICGLFIQGYSTLEKMRNEGFFSHIFEN